MRFVRGALSLIVLVGLVVGAPVLLVMAWHPPDLSSGIGVLFTPDDGRLLTTFIALIGWGAWLVFTVSVIAEIAERALHRTLSFGRGSLRLPRAAAGVLVGAVIALAVARVTVVPAVAQPMTLTAGEEADSAAGTRNPTDEIDRSSPGPSAVPSTGLPTYVVQPGDDLWTLAQQLLGAGERWNEIVAHNPHLDPRADLTTGMTLSLPRDAACGPGDGDPHAPGKPTEAVAEQDIPRPSTVTVTRGDTLWDLAEELLGSGERWRELYDLNRDVISDPDEIDVGWVLRLPKPVVPRADLPPLPPQSESTIDPGADEPAETDEQPSAPDGESDTDPDADEIAGESSGSLALLALGGVGPLLAGAVITALSRSRDIQRWGRPPGRRFVTGADGSGRIESALRGAAVQGPPDLLTVGLRTVAEYCHVLRIALDTIGSVTSRPRRLEIAFTSQVAESPDGSATPPECPTPPVGFTVENGGWVLTAAAAAKLEPPIRDHPQPVLVTLGSADDGSMIHTSLLAAPVLGITGPDEAVAAVTAGWTLELTCAPWASSIHLCVTPGLREMTRAATSEVLVARPDELVMDLEEAAARRSGRPHDPRDTALVYVFDGVLPDDLHRRVVDAVRPGLGIGVIVAGAASAATWELSDAEAGPVGTLVPNGPTLRAQQVPSHVRTALATLQTEAESTDSVHAPWWDHSGSGNTHNRSQRPPSQSTQESAMVAATARQPQHPILRILGPIDLLGTRGTPPSRGLRTCMEYCGWLLEHPGSTGAAMSSSMLVAESSRRSTVCRLRAWLGRDETGTLYLPEAYSGRLHMHSDVTSDWYLLQLLIARGVNRTSPEMLTTALGMVRGAILADAAPGQWHWAEELRTDIAATIRDIGVVLTEHAIDEGDIDLARWATARALTAAPEDEQLLRLRIRTEWRVGNHHEVERLALRTTAHARRLGVDLSDETVTLLQEVMEGRIRARGIASDPREPHPNVQWRPAESPKRG